MSDNPEIAVKRAMQGPFWLESDEGIIFSSEGFASYEEAMRAILEHIKEQEAKEELNDHPTLF